MRRYGSFLVHWWRAEGGQQRLRIRHIQSDAELTVTLIAEAEEWMAARVADPPRSPPDLGVVAPQRDDQSRME